MFNFATEFKLITTVMVLNEKQKEILLVAENLFSMNGIDGTSIRDISKAAGINVAMISYYFGSKNQLISALFEIRLTRIREKLTNLTQNHDLNPLEKLVFFVEDMLTILMKNADFHIIMIRQFSKKNVDEEISDNIFLLQREIMKVIRGFIQDGHQQGYFKAQPDPEALVIITIGSISYLIHHEKMYSSYWNTENHEEYSLYIKQHIYPYLINSLKAILQYNEQK